jgi:hypothetical protein
VLELVTIPQLEELRRPRVAEQSGPQSGPRLVRAARQPQPLHHFSNRLVVVGGTFDRLAQIRQSFLGPAEAHRCQTVLREVLDLFGVEFHRAAIVFHRLLQVAAIFGPQRPGHEEMISRTVGPEAQGDGQVPPRSPVLAPLQVQFGQTNLSLLGRLGRQFTEAGQACQDAQGVAALAHVLIAAAHHE